MKQLSILCIMIGVILMLAATGLAADSVVVLNTGFTIDGKLDEPLWDQATWYTFDDSTATVENGSWGNFSGEFALATNGTKLFFAFKAVDEKLVGNQSGADIWKNDCIELWFDWDSNKRVQGPGYYQIGLAPRDSSGKAACWAWRVQTPEKEKKAREGIVVASSETADGWIVEASMELAAFSGALPLSDGDATFNVSVVNYDDDSAVWSQSKWNHITWSGNNHTDPNNFVPLQF